VAELAMLQKVGFFHFGMGHDDPKAALERALEEAEEINERPSGVGSGPTDALIVLPEAFNIRVPYRGVGKRNVDRSILNDLQDVAGRFGVVFVTGLIIREEGGPTPPHSAAYLIDGIGSTLMGYKIGPDDTVGCNYTACSGKADLQNPIQYQDLWVGALICVDAHFPNSMSELLCDRRERVINACRVICAPVHMAKGNLGNGKSGSTVALIPGWTDRRLVVANSKADGIDSFITDTSGTILEPTVGGPQNRVIVLPLA
jgi:predicted amidohydrolase